MAWSVISCCPHVKFSHIRNSGTKLDVVILRFVSMECEPHKSLRVSALSSAGPSVYKENAFCSRRCCSTDRASQSMDPRPDGYWSCRRAQPAPNCFYIAIGATKVLESRNAEAVLTGRMTSRAPVQIFASN